MDRLRRATFVIALISAFAALTASPALAQPGQSSSAVGEQYWVEFSVNWWAPSLTGVVASDRLGLVGSSIDFVRDLGFDQSRKSDIRLVVRPATKHKFRFQYTPTDFTGAAVLTRDITFAGQVYPVSLPVASLLTWTVVRFGYEWDFLYKPRGFVGVLAEVRKTDLTASVDSIIGGAAIEATAPSVALGIVARAYPMRRLAIGGEVNGIKLDTDADQSLKMLEMEISATYNVTRNFGVSAGWRRTNTSLVLDADRGEVDFRGMWFGGVIRY